MREHGRAALQLLYCIRFSGGDMTTHQAQSFLQSIEPLYHLLDTPDILLTFSMQNDTNVQYNSEEIKAIFVEHLPEALYKMLTANFIKLITVTTKHGWIYEVQLQHTIRYLYTIWADLKIMPHMEAWTGVLRIQSIWEASKMHRNLTNSQSYIGQPAMDQTLNHQT